MPDLTTLYTKAFLSFIISCAGTIESCPSSPLFIPVKLEKKSMRKTRKHIKDGVSQSTDSEGAAAAGIKETSKPKRRKGQSNQKQSKGKAAGNKRGEGERDSKGPEVLQRPAVTDCEDQASSTRLERAHNKMNSKVTTRPTEKQQLSKTTKVLG